MAPYSVLGETTNPERKEKAADTEYDHELISHVVPFFSLQTCLLLRVK